MTTILVIKPNPKMGKEIEEILAAEGMRSLIAESPEQGFAYLDNANIDLVVLDLDRGGDEGSHLCWEIRERTTAPLLVFAEDGAQATLARGLELGADAYLEKPFAVRILLAQIYALLRRVGEFRQGHAGQLEVEGLTINVIRQEVMVDGEPVHLTPTEYKILSCLVRNSGRALSHRSLVKEVQGYECPPHEAREILKVHIHNLRQKIEPHPRQPRFIRSVRGFGYLFERRCYDRERLEKTLT